MKRWIGLGILCGVLFVALASGASAGGWAVVTLDAVPQGVVVNEPVRVGMTIRQHGQTPWVYDDVRVRGFHSTGESFLLHAAMDERGHYTTELVFNKAGKWQWAVASGLMPEWQPMPDIEVATPAQDEALFAEANAGTTAPAPFSAMISNTLLLAVGVIGLVGSAGGLALWWSRRK